MLNRLSKWNMSETKTFDFLLHPLKTYSEPALPSLSKEQQHLPPFSGKAPRSNSWLLFSPPSLPQQVLIDKKTIFFTNVHRYNPSLSHHLHLPGLLLSFVYLWSSFCTPQPEWLSDNKNIGRMCLSPAQHHPMASHHTSNETPTHHHGGQSYENLAPAYPPSSCYSTGWASSTLTFTLFAKQAPLVSVTASSCSLFPLPGYLSLRILNVFPLLWCHLLREWFPDSCIK